MPKVIVMVLDGCDPAYLQAANTPNIDALGASGYFGQALSAVPSVTNVNHVSIATGTFPEVHGIASNYWYDPATGQGEYVEDNRYLLKPAVFGEFKSKGFQQALLVTKQKLLRLLDSGVDVPVAAEAPPPEVITAVGPAQPIYSAEIDYWTMNAMQWVLQERRPDFVYATTTDYTFHMQPPESDIARRHVERIDQEIGRIAEECPEYAIILTADHGMAAKSRGLDPARLLAAKGIEAVFVPPIKDRYRAHHGDMGGVGYLYVDANQRDTAKAILLATIGMEEVLSREEAVARFRLPASRIGDLVLLADPDTVFGELDAPVQEVQIRSHGSHHERTVPMMVHGARVEAGELLNSLDLLALVRRLLGA
jgi:phosphonoacetate hydrolase